MRLRPEPFLVAAVVCLLGAAALSVALTEPFEAALWSAVGAVLGGLFAGLSAGLSGPDLPDIDYTAFGSILVGVALLSLALLAGRPAGGYLAAVGGGLGAALVGLESGLKRADR